MGRAASYLRSERLEKVARINTDLRINEERLRDLRDSMQSLHSIQYGDKVQKSGSVDRITENLAKIESIEECITRDMAELEKEKQHTLEEIQELKKPEHTEVLYYRYVELLSWKEITCKLHFSKRHVLRLHREALGAFENVPESP